jgi:hypothetical protein
MNLFVPDRRKEACLPTKGGWCDHKLVKAELL